MIRKLLVLGAVALLATAVFAARPGRVVTKDGTVYEGQVEERESGLVINVKGIETIVARDNIASVTYGTPLEQFEKDLAALNATDVKGRIALARRAFDAREYNFALRVLDEALTIDPNNAEAADFQKSVTAQRRLKSVDETPGGTSAGDHAAGGNSSETPARPATGPTATPATGKWKTITADDINRIRQFELRDSDTRVTIQFANNVVKKYADGNPDVDFQQFRKMSNLQQAIAIIERGGDLAKDVRINNDPASLKEWQAKIQPVVLAGCATSGCHGGSMAVAPVLIMPASDVAATYTNFYALTTYDKKAAAGDKEGSMFGGADARMIDRDNPDRSLLLTYGLANAAGGMKHPEVKGYTAVFPRGREEKSYQMISSWISGQLRRTTPDYGVSFEPGRMPTVGQ